MTIEVALLLTGTSVCAAVYFGICAKRRNDKADARQDNTTMTTVMVKLETIGAGVNEIKADIRNVREDVNATRERLIVCEQSVKQAHKRLDETNGRCKPAEE